MKDQAQQEEPLPEGWLVEFFTRADLEDSFTKLEACGHFYAEALRGRIRSVQLRTREATRHFDRATQLAREVEHTIPNLIRGFLLSLYKLENSLLEEPFDEDEELPELTLPEVPEQMVEDYPEVKLLFDLRLSAEALVRLHVGDWGLSSSIYRALITRNGKGPEDVLVMYYLGLAASEHNLGLTDSAQRSFENAGLCLSLGGRLLNRVRGAGCLYAFYRYLGLKKEASEWKAFIDRLDCPQETKRVFLKRGTRQVERCTQQARLVLL